ncbi:DMT family transporter [Pseudenterobacter timonensis]|uniref:DMT family transporter n=1 Tax=Pseudenterobacter timonensis TaxID=1755099 RepID=A0AAE4DPT2_9ENTR|nr:DMT family transporter [Pseudenterobacter timonensis]MDR9891598.1 DMT family transporter [Pseudenterobacter timonensis]
MKKLLLVLFVLTAFAANSILCRIALKNGHADPETFSMLRLLGGAAALFFWHIIRKKLQEIRWKIIDALLLCAYVLFFSLAYVQLSTATGALLLFGAVQVCMIGWGALKRETLSGSKAFGILLAVGGIVVLLLPGTSAPPLLPALMMVASGLAWGAYSVRGKNIVAPAGTTAGNFILSIPVMLALSLLRQEPVHVDASGILLALLSGGVASGIAYVLWYQLVPGLSSATASTLQLSVPCIAAAGGVLFLGEVPDLRMVICTLVVLAGIALVISADRQ